MCYCCIDARTITEPRRFKVTLITCHPLLLLIDLLRAFVLDWLIGARKKKSRSCNVNKDWLVGPITWGYIRHQLREPPITVPNKLFLGKKVNFFLTFFFKKLIAVTFGRLLSDYFWKIGFLAEMYKFLGENVQFGVYSLKNKYRCDI